MMNFGYELVVKELKALVSKKFVPWAAVVGQPPELDSKFLSRCKTAEYGLSENALSFRESCLGDSI